jgi:hypothetical protein
MLSGAPAKALFWFRILAHARHARNRAIPSGQGLDARKTVK